MKEPQYSKALSRAWQLTWHHKELWIFGLFAGLLGQMGLVEMLSQSTLAAMHIDNPSGMLYVWYVLQNMWHSVAAMSLGASEYIGLVWIVVLLGGLTLAFVYVAVVAQGALVHSAARYASSRRKKLANVGASWHEGRVHFWRVFALNIMRKFVVFLFSSFVAWATINAVLHASAGYQVLYLLVFIFAGLTGMILSMWVIYAIGYVVVEEYKLIPALRSAWRLFIDHWLVSFEIGIILIALNAVLILFLIAGIFFFFLPTFFLWSIAVSLGGHVALMSIGLSIGIVLASMWCMFVVTLFSTYSITIWTYLFTKMHKHGIVSHMVDLFHGKRG